MIVIILAVAIVLIAIVVFATNNDSNSGDAVIEATPSVTGDDTAAGNVLTNDTDPDAADTKDDAEESSREEEIDLELYLATPVGNKGLKTHLCEGRIYRKERNMKAKNSKRKGDFKPWQVR